MRKIQLQKTEQNIFVYILASLPLPLSRTCADTRSLVPCDFLGGKNCNQHALPAFFKGNVPMWQLYQRVYKSIYSLWLYQRVYGYIYIYSVCVCARACVCVCVCESEHIGRERERERRERGVCVCVCVCEKGILRFYKYTMRREELGSILLRCSAFFFMYSFVHIAHILSVINIILSRLLNVIYYSVKTLKLNPLYKQIGKTKRKISLYFSICR